MLRRKRTAAGRPVVTRLGAISELDAEREAMATRGLFVSSATENSDGSVRVVWSRHRRYGIAADGAAALADAEAAIHAESAAPEPAPQI
jgi:hypothetical protein